MYGDRGGFQQFKMHAMLLNPISLHLEMASILRNSIARNARIVARGNIVAGRVPLFVRYSSSQPPLAPEEIMKQVLEKHGNLQRDNNAKTVGYEELLPLTQSLPEVSVSSRCILSEQFLKLNLSRDRILLSLTFERQRRPCKE